MAIPPDPDPFQKSVTFGRDFPLISATKAFAIATVSGRSAPIFPGFPGSTPMRCKIDRVELMVDTDYAADAVNYYLLELVHGPSAVVAASWSTQTGGLLAAVPVDMTLADTSIGLNFKTYGPLVAAYGEVLSLRATKFGAAPNILPRAIVHGRYF